MKRPRYRNYKVIKALRFRRMTDKQKRVQRQKDRKRRIQNNIFMEYFRGRMMTKDEMKQLLLSANKGIELVVAKP